MKTVPTSSGPVPTPAKKRSAHRLPTVREADTIYVLERGTIVEYGDWDTLIGKEGGRFEDLAKQVADRDEMCHLADAWRSDIS